jgi:hypothetical protein
MGSITFLLCNRQGEALDCFRLAMLGVITALAVAVSACAEPAAGRRAVPSYDDFTGRLVQLSADQNGDGRLDQWTYLEGNRPLRGEADANADGRIDRWEYFNAESALVMVGTSSLDDGIEDTWTETLPAASGEVHVARSRRRDRQRRAAEVLVAARRWRGLKKTPMPMAASTVGTATKARSFARRRLTRR